VDVFLVHSAYILLGIISMQHKQFRISLRVS